MAMPLRSHISPSNMESLTNHSHFANLLEVFFTQLSGHFPELVTRPLLEWVIVWTAWTLHFYKKIWQSGPIRQVCKITTDVKWSYSCFVQFHFCAHHAIYKNNTNNQSGFHTAYNQWFNRSSLVQSTNIFKLPAVLVIPIQYKWLIPSCNTHY